MRKKQALTTYYCNGTDCSGRTRVWKERGRWIGKDLRGNEVFLECRHVPPLPPNWTIIGGEYFCSHHKLTIHPAEVQGREMLIGKEEDFVTVSGLAALEKP